MWLKGVLHLLPKLACFVLNLKIITIFLKKIDVSNRKLFKELKNGIEILVDQSVGPI